MSLCRHEIEILSCEQCCWEIREGTKRFEAYIKENIRQDRLKIESSSLWKQRMGELEGLT